MSKKNEGKIKLVKCPNLLGDLATQTMALTSKTRAGAVVDECNPGVGVSQDTIIVSSTDKITKKQHQKQVFRCKMSKYLCVYLVTMKGRNRDETKYSIRYSILRNPICLSIISTPTHIKLKMGNICPKS